MPQQNQLENDSKRIVSQAAGGVVARLVKDNILIALVREAGFHDYILPKGSVEPGESLEEAARREIHEEAGLNQLILLVKLGISERWNYRKTAWKVIHYYLFITEQVTGQPKDTSHDYICEWYPLDALPDMFWTEQKDLIITNHERIISTIKEYTRASLQERK